MERFHECYALVGAIDALAVGTGATTTDVIDARDAQELVFVVNVGTIAATGTVDFHRQYGHSHGHGHDLTDRDHPAYRDR